MTRMTSSMSALAVRMTVSTLIFGALALVALVVTAPTKVTIPLATVLVAGFAIGGVFGLVDRNRSRTRVMGGVDYSSPAGVLGRLR